MVFSKGGIKEEKDLQLSHLIQQYGHHGQTFEAKNIWKPEGN